MALGSVVEQLQGLKDSQDKTTTSVNAVVKVISEQIRLQEQSRLDDLEAAAERLSLIHI